MSTLITCPAGHLGRFIKALDKRADGFTPGGAADHATRCADMADKLGVEAPVVTGRGPRTEAEAIAAAAAKWSAKSAPTVAAPAGERVILADGRIARIEA